jgi:hypothetical protein
MKKWKSILTMVLALVVAFSVPAMASDVTLKATQTSENSVAIEMENDVPILGVEFVLNNIAAESLETTSRTEDFLAVFNDLGGQRVKVVLVSLKKDAISAGSGPILEFVYDGIVSGDLEMTDVNVADANNQPVVVNKNRQLIGNL